MVPLFRNRRDAGQQLAAALAAYKKRGDVTVLALPRGGVPVAFEIAQALAAPLDLMLVRKLGVPGEEELAMGAIALPDVTVFNDDVIRSVGITREEIEDAVAREAKELKRRNDIYRGGAPPSLLEDRIVIVVDDGAATGANMRAALLAVAHQQPRRSVAAIPVAPKPVIGLLEKMADEVICLHTPPLFFAVGQVYEDFSAVKDEEVLMLLREARHVLTTEHPHHFASHHSH